MSNDYLSKLNLFFTCWFWSSINLRIVFNYFSHAAVIQDASKRWATHFHIQQRGPRQRRWVVVWALRQHDVDQRPGLLPGKLHQWLLQQELFALLWVHTLWLLLNWFYATDTVHLYQLNTLVFLFITPLFLFGPHSKPTQNLNSGWSHGVCCRRLQSQPCPWDHC